MPSRHQKKRKKSREIEAVKRVKSASLRRKAKAIRMAKAEAAIAA